MNLAAKHKCDERSILFNWFVTVCVTLRSSLHVNVFFNSSSPSLVSCFNTGELWTRDCYSNSVTLQFKKKNCQLSTACHVVLCLRTSEALLFSNYSSLHKVLSMKSVLHITWTLTNNMFFLFLFMCRAIATTLACMSRKYYPHCRLSVVAFHKRNCGSVSGNSARRSKDLIGGTDGRILLAYNSRHSRSC